MIFMIWKALGLYKYLVIAALAAAAYWFVWDTGRGYERARWEAAMAAEVARQAEIVNAALEASRIAAGLLMDAEDQREELVRRLQREAHKSPSADAVCLGADSIMRLNTIGGDAEAP